jgi:hypothetical protein
MSKLIAGFLFIVGVINFLPVIGVISAERIAQAYAIELSGNDLIILMRHRALLFGVVGGFILYSVFVPAFQAAAMVMAAVAMIGYLYLVWAVGGYNDAIQRVATIDLVGIIFLVAAAGLKFVDSSRH